MIHEYARCPFCDDCILAIDDQLPAFLINPHCDKGEACPHLVLATVCIEVERGQRGRSAAPCGPTGVWRWARDAGLLGPEADADDLGDYLTDLACDSLPGEEYFPTIPYRLVGAYASERESKHTGWGYFPIVVGESVLTGMVNGWALFSLRPQELMADIRYRVLSDCGGEEDSAEASSPIDLAPALPEGVTLQRRRDKPPSKGVAPKRG